MVDLAEMVTNDHLCFGGEWCLHFYKVSEQLVVAIAAKSRESLGAVKCRHICIGSSKIICVW